MRDPFGAIVAVAAERDEPSGAVAWHELHVRDHARAWALYGEMFGWRKTEALDLGPALGSYEMFSFGEGGPSVGGMVSSARMPQVHTHWLFYFRVDDLDAALTRVRARGGNVLEPRRLPSGDRLAPCEDPQGAAFGLYSSAARA
nr:VOC family protein [Polyangium spumosum]